MARTRILDTLKTMAVLAAATAVGFLLETIGLSQANIITVYILGVLVVAAVTASRWSASAHPWPAYCCSTTYSQSPCSF